MFRLQSYKKIADSKRFSLYFYIFVVNSNAKDVNSNAKHEPIGLFDKKNCRNNAKRAENIDF